MARLTLKNKQANLYADTIILEKLSIREVARKFGVSKTTVYNYLKEYATGVIRKRNLDKQLARNKATGYRKGGEVTKQKYLSAK